MSTRNKGGKTKKSYNEEPIKSEKQRDRELSTTSEQKSKRGKSNTNKKSKANKENEETLEETMKNLDLTKGSTKLKLKRMIVENFKSFNGKHEIGIFQNFSVILGPNGSGKSNILDAICFALGVKTANLRTKNLKELIFKYENENEAEIKKRNCSVELFFVINREEIVCKRTIHEKGTSDFYFNKKKMVQEDYIKSLEDYKIPIKSKYFILLQGAIDSILGKKNDITETFEILSGSIEYKEEYDKLKLEIGELNTKIDKLSTEMHTLKEDKGKLKIQIENEEKYNELVAQAQDRIERYFLFKLAFEDAKIEETEKLSEMNKSSLKDIEKDQEASLDFIKDKERETKKHEEDIKVREKDLKKIRKEIDDNSLNMNKFDESIRSYESLIYSKTSLLHQEKKDKEHRDKKIAEAKKKETDYKVQMEEIEKKLNIQQYPENNLKENQVEEYYRLNTKYETETLTKRNEKDYLNKQLAEISSQKLLREKTLFNLENDIQSHESEVLTITNKMKVDEDSIIRNETEALQLRHKYEQTKNIKEKKKIDYDKVLSTISTKYSELTSLESEVNEKTNRKKLNDLMKENPDGIKGFLFQLIKPVRKSLDLPVKVSLIKYLGYLVVDKNETAKICSDYLKKNGLSHDVLILENIPKYELSHNARVNVGSYGSMMIDLINIDNIPGLKNAIAYFLKDLVFCEHNRNIERLREKKFFSIITTDGTFYKKGVISGGKYKNIDQYTFDYQNSKNNIDKLEKEIEKLNSQKLDLEKELAGLDEGNLRIKFMEKENYLDLVKSSVEIYKSNLAEYEKQIKKKKNQFELIDNELKKTIQDESILKENEKKLSKSLNTIKEEIFINFMNINNIKSIEEFESNNITVIKRLSEELQNLQNKYFKIIESINIMKKKDELIDKLEAALSQDREKLRKTKDEKIDCENRNKTMNETYNKKFEEDQKFEEELKAVKLQIKMHQRELDEYEKRKRDLAKNRITYDHSIARSIENKNSIIEDSKQNISSYVQQKIDDTFTVFVNFDIDIEKYKIEDVMRGNKKDFKFDYSKVEKKGAIKELSPEQIKEKFEKLEFKFVEQMREIEKYVKIVNVDPAESEKLRQKQEELNKTKIEKTALIKDLVNDNEKKKEEFNGIKTKRKSLYEEFFTKVSQTLAYEYKELTKSPMNMNQGGSCYIYNTNKDEPYNGSIVYLPTPPGKRAIYDIDQLSGGEKTIAILSLIISFQKIWDGPLIILDEVDSYLDPEHESIIERMFKLYNKMFQIIIITHKPNIFKSAHSLIGTYFNSQEKSSIPITLNMFGIINNSLNN